MKFIVPLLILSASTFNLSCASNKFMKLCSYSDIYYSIPQGFKPFEIKQNPDLKYHYAVKHKNKKLEIRYSIFPLKEEVQAYNEYLKNGTKKKIVLIDPNKDHELFAITAVMNISRSELANACNAIGPDAVKHDFNADWGASYCIENNSEYGRGYKYSLIVATHKINIANAFIVYLFDNEKDISDEMRSSLSSLKFK